MNSTIEPRLIASLPKSMGGPAAEDISGAGAELGGAQRTAVRRDLDWRDAMEQAQLANWFGDGRDRGHANAEAAPASAPETGPREQALAGVAQAHMRRAAQAQAGEPAIDCARTSACVAAFGQAAQRYAMAFDSAASAGVGKNEQEEGQESAQPSAQPPQDDEQAPRLFGATPAPFVAAVVEALADTLGVGSSHVAADPASVPGASGVPVPTAARAADVRVHAQWTQDGVLVWVGIARDAAMPLAALQAGLAGWLAEHGLRLAGLVCNGRAVELRPRPMPKETGVLDDTREYAFALPNQLHSEETP